MTETNQKIIDMILKGASANEISCATGLSNKQLFYRLNMLRTKGYNFSRKYYYNGEITYKLQKGLETEKDIALITRHNDTEIKAVFISDLHLTNVDERVDLLNQVYEFCAKEGINIILNGGDIIDGFVGYPNSKKYRTSEEQINYALKVYPFDKNILNFTCLGNHDYSVLNTSGQNLETVLQTKRHDIIPLGYGRGKLKIKNEEITVLHPKTPVIGEHSPIKKGFVLVGHYHVAKNCIKNEKVSVALPSLSDMKIFGETNHPFPSFIKAIIRFAKGYYSQIILEQYIFIDDKMYKISESVYDLIEDETQNKDIIKYEEERTPYKEEKAKVLEKHQTGLSQIEKFNKRYSK